MSNTKLSIIIPHFNESDLLRKLLLSIPDNDSIQVIVVDDKSENHHVRNIEEFKKEFNFEFYQNDRIKSAGTCRNIGLEHAKGEWVIFADSDDYFVDGFYNIVSKYFDNNNDVVFFLPTSVYIDTNKVADRHLAFEKKIVEYSKLQSKINELNVRYMIPNPICKMIKKEFIDQNNILFDEVRISDDVMFSTRVGHKMKSFEVSLEVIYCITRNQGSLTTLMKEEMFDVQVGVAVKNLKYINERLNKRELNILKPESIGWLTSAMSRYGFNKLIQVYRIFKKNDIKWFYWKYINPVLILKKIILKYKKHSNNNKYYVKQGG